MKPTNSYNPTSLAIVCSFQLQSPRSTAKSAQPWWGRKAATFSAFDFRIHETFHPKNVRHNASQIHYFLRTMSFQQPSQLQIGGSMGASNMSPNLCLSRSNSLIPQSQGDVQ